MSESHAAQAAPAARKAPQRPPPPSVRPDLDRVAAAGRPWWADAPDVAWKCAVLAFAPVRMAVLAAEAAVSLVFLAAFATVALWWTGYISDAAVAGFLGDLGDRALSILQSSGVI